MTLKHRYDFLVLFDVKDGNPNGDPDAGNLPRIDPDTDQGLVSDVCLKRKIRNCVQVLKEGTPGYELFIKDRSVLSVTTIETAALAGVQLTEVSEESTDDEANDADDADDAPKKKAKVRTKRKLLPADAVQKVQDAVCRRFFDVRTFGAVLTTVGAQVRGPVQVIFARSIDPISHQEHCITRVAVASASEAASKTSTMGSKSTVAYGLYKAHGFISPALAARTGFDDTDLDVLWSAIQNMFEHDRSAARGLMSVRRLLVFRHDSALGNAQAHRLFDQVRVTRRDPTRLPRSFDDYEVVVGDLPSGVTLLDM